MTPAVDLWYDVVYHVLSHLPVAADDASCLYDQEYVKWSDRHFTGPGPTRTMSPDATLMAELYNASKRGFLLNAWPTLWHDTAAFLRDAATDFDALTWPRPDRRHLARHSRVSARRRDRLRRLDLAPARPPPLGTTQPRFCATPRPTSTP